MRIFIDTSALLKKYVLEEGDVLFEEMLTDAAEIAVSPITRIEMNAAITRKIASGTLTSDQASWIRQEVGRDLNYYFQVLWIEALENEAGDFTCKQSLKTFDAIQLASGILSNSKFFLTSDEKLFKEAKKVLSNALLV